MITGLAVPNRNLWALKSLTVSPNHQFSSHALTNISDISELLYKWPVLSLMTRPRPCQEPSPEPKDHLDTEGCDWKIKKAHEILSGTYYFKGREIELLKRSSMINHDFHTYLWFYHWQWNIDHKQLDVILGEFHWLKLFHVWVKFAFANGKCILPGNFTVNLEIDCIVLCNIDCFTTSIQ